MSDLVKEITAEQFDVLSKEETPVLLDFSAVWCAPCKMLAPLLEQAAAQYQGRVAVVKVDVDQEQGLAARFGVRGIPTLIMVKKGQVVAQQVGVLPQAQLSAFIEKNI